MRQVLVGLGVVVALVLVIIALLPTLVSTDAGTRAVLGMAGGAVRGDVRVDSLSVGWFSPTRVRGLVVDDAEGIRVVDLGEFTSDLTLLGAVRGWMRDAYDLGETVVDVSLPSVRVYPDGTTSLDRTFDIAGDPDAPTPEVRGTILVRRLDATVQQVDADGRPLRDEAGVAVPFYGVTVENGRVVLAGDSVENDLVASVRVNNMPAGTASARGTATFDGGATQTLTLDGLDLRTLATFAAAAGVEVPVALAGTAGGSFALDTSTGTLAGRFDVADFAAAPGPDVPGYASSQVTLEVNGSADATRAQVERLRLVTDDGRADASFAFMLGDDAPPGPAAVRDVRLDVAFPFLTASGGGPSLAGLDVAFTADADALQETFGDLVRLEDVAYGGRVEGRLRTQTRGAGLAARVDAEASDVRYAPAGVEPLVIDAAWIDAVATAAEGGRLADVLVNATVGGDTPWAGLALAVAELDANSQSVIGLDLRQATLADYERARAALGGVATLPELEADPGPVTLAATGNLQGLAGDSNLQGAVRSGRKVVAEFDLRGGREADAVTTWAGRIDVADVSAAAALASAFGTDLGDAAGGLTVTANGGTRGDMPVWAQGVVRLNDLRATGLVANGGLRFDLAEGVVRLSDDRGGVSLNNGRLSLAGTTLDLATLRLDVPAGEVLYGVNLNPLLTDALGRFVNPVLTGPDDARGLLDVSLASATWIDLNDPLAGDVTVEFAIRDFAVTNDVVAWIADDVADQARRELLGRAGAAARIPGLNLTDLVREQVSVGDELRGELATIRGAIVDSRVQLSGGKARTRLTVQAADPRQSRADDDTLYDVTFTGDVDVQTLAADLSVVLPVELVEKWAGESPGDLVRYLGPRPFRRIMPDGVRLAFGGTTRVPTVDASASLRAIAPRAIEALVENAGVDLLPRGIRDLFR